MIRRIVLIALILFLASVPGTVMAQDNKVTTAALNWKAGDFEAAKKDIDAAYAHSETANSIKMFHWRAKIYGSLYTLTKMRDFLFIAVESHLKVIDMDKTLKKNRDFTDEAKEVLIQYAGELYNVGIITYNARHYDTTVMALPLILKIIPYDREKLLEQSRITDTSIYEISGQAAYLSEPKKCNLVYEYYNKLLSMGYNDYNAYLIMEDCYLSSDRDTAKAMETIEKGKARFPNEKKLNDEELALYLAMGKQQELMSKLNSSIEKYPNEYSTYFVRGNIYDHMIKNLQEREDMLKDSMDNVNSKAKVAKTPQQKNLLTAQAGRIRKERDSLVKVEEGYIKLAEADYKKCIELAKGDSARADAYFNMAGLTLHKTRPVVDKMNETSNEANYKALNKILTDQYKEAIGYMLQYEKVHPDDVSALETLKQLYFKTEGDSPRYKEYDQKYKNALKKNKSK